MTKMHFVFRTDASKEIGSGHVMRCLSLACALKEKGGDVLFICREHDGNLCSLIEKNGFTVKRLPLTKEKFVTEDNLAHAGWLGAGWREDAEQTASIIRDSGLKPDWLIVDHYALDCQWEKFIRPFTYKIFVIDDIADRNHDCDLLLDQNLFADIQNRYYGKVPDECQLLLGPDYALLQPVYAELHDRIPPRNGPVKRILIYFGGADTDNLTGLALSAFISLNRPDIEVDVIISKNSQYNSIIQDLSAGYDNINLHVSLPTLAPIMAKADLAIGAAGTTSWERLCFGLPSLIITLADNQKLIASGLHEEGLAVWAGHKDEVSEENIRQLLAKIIDEGVDQKLSIECSNRVDGKGACRVASVMTITKDSSLKVRNACLSDEILLLKWVNDPENRNDLFSFICISSEVHHKWFYTKMRDLDKCRIYIVETEDCIPLGQVRFEKEGNFWDIHYLLAPEFLRKRLGRKLLEIALFNMRSEIPGVFILGKVKGKNSDSHKIFDNLGFEMPFGEERKKLSISLCSDENSWINSYIPELILEWQYNGHKVMWSHDASLLPKGDLCFYLSYGKIVGPELLRRYKNNLVVHASDLPEGRGWSPLTWQTLEGKNSIPVTLFEAAEAVDSGQIYKKLIIKFSGTELIEEMRNYTAKATLELCRSFVEDYPEIVNKGVEQEGQPTYYPRRKPKDSFIDPGKTLIEQFNLLRTVDNENYPAWFEIKDNYFVLKVYKKR